MIRGAESCEQGHRQHLPSSRPGSTRRAIPGQGAGFVPVPGNDPQQCLASKWLIQPLAERNTPMTAHLLNFIDQRLVTAAHHVHQTAISLGAQSMYHVAGVGVSQRQIEKNAFWVTPIERVDYLMCGRKIFRVETERIENPLYHDADGWVVLDDENDRSSVRCSRPLSASSPKRLLNKLGAHAPPNIDGSPYPGIQFRFLFTRHPSVIGFCGTQKN